MNRQIEFAGKSGARYRYTPLEEDRFIPPAGANFVIADLAGDGPSIVYAGETDNLASQAWRKVLEEARKTYAEVKQELYDWEVLPSTEANRQPPTEEEQRRADELHAEAAAVFGAVQA